MAKILFSKAIETMRDSSTSGLVLQYQNGSTEKDTEWGIPGKLKRAYQDYHTRYAHKISTPDRTRTCTSETPDPKSGASTNSATGAVCGCKVKTLLANNQIISLKVVLQTLLLCLLLYQGRHP